VEERVNLCQAWDVCNKGKARNIGARPQGDFNVSHGMNEKKKKTTTSNNKQSCTCAVLLYYTALYFGS